MAFIKINSKELFVDSATGDEYEQNPDGTLTKCSTNGAMHVTTAGSPATVDTRIARFDAAADMPADITSDANVAADRAAVGAESRDRAHAHPRNCPEVPCTR